MAEIATPQLDQYLKDWQGGGQKRKENLDKFVDRPFPPMPRVAHSSDEIAALGLDPQKFALWGDRSTDPGDIAAAQKARDGIKKLHSDINMLLDRAKQRDGTNTTFKVVAGIVTFLGSFGTAVATAYEGHNDIKFVGALVTAFAAFITMGADVKDGYWRLDRHNAGQIYGTPGQGGAGRPYAACKRSGCDA